MKPEKQKESPNRGLKIKISENGPYLISGGVPLSKQIIGIDADGHSYEWQEGARYPLQKNYALCRCGQSNNKPFCDGTHWHNKFTDDKN